MKFFDRFLVILALGLGSYYGYELRCQHEAEANVTKQEQEAVLPDCGPDSAQEPTAAGYERRIQAVNGLFSSASGYTTEVGAYQLCCDFYRGASGASLWPVRRLPP